MGGVLTLPKRRSSTSANSSANAPVSSPAGARALAPQTKLKLPDDLNSDFRKIDGSCHHYLRHERECANVPNERGCVKKMLSNRADALCSWNSEIKYCQVKKELCKGACTTTMPKYKGMPLCHETHAPFRQQFSQLIHDRAKAVRR
jgi:hypothetical protein